MKKRLMATLLALVMALGLCVTTAWAEEEVTYLNADGTTGTCTDYTTVTSTTTTWESGWYVVKGNVTIDGIYTGNVTITGDAKLILYDGATLTVSNQVGDLITISGSLTVYGQTDQSGTLNVVFDESHGGAGVGNGIVGSITVNSGKVTTSYGSDGYGITGDVTVKGGWVEAYGGGFPSDCGIGGSVTVTAGYLYAKGPKGIEGSAAISGGTVIASSIEGAIWGSVELPASYKWRTVENGAFTKSSATAYSNESKPQYVEIVACHDLGDWVTELPATCTEPGTVGHKTCSICDKHFDANGKEITDLTIPTINHRLTHVDARAATRQEAGNIEYWQCSDCQQCFADENGQMLIIQADTVIAKLPSKNNNSTPTTATTETVASPKTGDVSMALYGALALTSLLGMGYVGKKR